MQHFPPKPSAPLLLTRRERRSRCYMRRCRHAWRRRSGHASDEQEPSANAVRGYDVNTEPGSADIRRAFLWNTLKQIVWRFRREERPVGPEDPRYRTIQSE